MTPERHRLIAAAGQLEVRLGGDGGSVEIEGVDPVLPTAFPIGEVAASALAEVGDAAAGLSRSAGGHPDMVTTSVVEGARSIISFALLQVNGEVIPRTNQSNPYVRLHRCGDGRWIFLHGGFAHLQQGLAELLGTPFDADFATVGAACQSWDAQRLEDSIADRGLCGAMVRTAEEWEHHPHGSQVNRLDTVCRQPVGQSLEGWEPTNPSRPLDGLRVLDLTRVLAGPTCGRTLAALGAEVLHVTGPTTPNVPGFVIDTGHGKRRSFCDLGSEAEREELQRLALDAHVIVQGYRPGVVARHGIDAARLREGGFRGIYANISCFGPVGPFADRAGWEQVAQAVSGIAITHGHSIAGNSIANKGEAGPALLPAAATDYTTGLRMAGAILRSLERGDAADLDASLCQTAAWIQRVGATCDPTAAVGIGSPATDPTAMDEVDSAFGRLRRLRPGVQVQEVDVSWRSATAALGSSSLEWRGCSS